MDSRALKILEDRASSATGATMQRTLNANPRSQDHKSRDGMKSQWIGKLTMETGF